MESSENLTAQLKILSDNAYSTQNRLDGYLRQVKHHDLELAKYIEWAKEEEVKLANAQKLITECKAKLYAVLGEELTGHEKASMM